MSKLRTNGLNAVFLITCMVVMGLVSVTASAMPESMSAQELLKRMAEAGRNLNYQGTFTYEHGGAMKSFRITHNVSGGKEYERLEYMNGPQAEVVRSGNPLACERAGDILLRGAIIESGIGYGNLEKYYQLQIKGADRVAGRSVTELHVIPKDQMRYGYVLSIDKGSSLLLRAMLIATSPKQVVLERFEFVQVAIGDELAEGQLLSSNDLPEEPGTVPCDEEGQDYQHWRVNWLPEGFVLTSVHKGNKEGAETLVFTDGLSFFSVFIDSGEGLSMPSLRAKRGATVAAMARAKYHSKEFSICVVGEIPMAVATRIARSVQANIK